MGLAFCKVDDPSDYSGLALASPDAARLRLISVRAIVETSGQLPWPERDGLVGVEAGSTEARAKGS
jgi:hypothetical protein